MVDFYYTIISRKDKKKGQKDRHGQDIAVVGILVLFPGSVHGVAGCVLYSSGLGSSLMVDSGQAGRQRQTTFCYHCALRVIYRDGPFLPIPPMINFPA